MRFSTVFDSIHIVIHSTHPRPHIFSWISLTTELHRSHLHSILESKALWVDWALHAEELACKANNAHQNSAVIPVCHDICVIIGYFLRFPLFSIASGSSVGYILRCISDNACLCVSYCLQIHLNWALPETKWASNRRRVLVRSNRSRLSSACSILSNSFMTYKRRSKSSGNVLMGRRWFVGYHRKITSTVQSVNSENRADN